VRRAAATYFSQQPFSQQKPLLQLLSVTMKYILFFAVVFLTSFSSSLFAQARPATTNSAQRVAIDEEDDYASALNDDDDLIGDGVMLAGTYSDTDDLDDADFETALLTDDNMSDDDSLELDADDFDIDSAFLLDDNDVDSSDDE